MADLKDLSVVSTEDLKKSFQEKLQEYDELLLTYERFQQLLVSTRDEAWAIAEALRIREDK